MTMLPNMRNVAAVIAKDASCDLPTSGCPNDMRTAN
jgi:hypothetical protein